MTSANPDTNAHRAGGYDVWTPRVTPGIGSDLTDEQQLAIVFRWLANEHFAENLLGHITWQRPEDTTMLVNPWGLWWNEITASDICEVDDDANVVRGRWDVTPAIHIHTELHRRRPDARVVIHNHPYYTSLLASTGLLPDFVHQTDGMFLDDLSFVNEYDGEIDSAELGADLAERIGSSNVVLLANHGVIVAGESLAVAAYRAATIERTCRMSFHARLLGGKTLPLDRKVLGGIQQSLLERGSDVFYAGIARQTIANWPNVLT